jgi:elongation factor 2 kinase
MDKLQALQEELTRGIIDPIQYEEKRTKIIDELTGTSSKPYIPPPNIYPTTNAHDSSNCKPDLKEYNPWGNTKRPPSYRGIHAERAYKFAMDELSGKWTRSQIIIKIDTEPFAKGSERVAYHSLEIGLEKDFPRLDSLEMHDEGTQCVAKLAIDPLEDNEIYFLNVWIQMFARRFALKYNECEPPKTVQFLSAWVLQLIDRKGSPLCAVEPYVPGEYRKHNNNFGFVSDVERNTPQAFSHFSYEFSDHKILICDIQGVNDLYTDPQVHSLSGKEFGYGDLGSEGLKRFLASHKCNKICRFFRLPVINLKTAFDEGTVPHTRYMSFDSLDNSNLQIAFLSRPSSSILSDTGVEPSMSDPDSHYLIGLPARMSASSKREVSLFA